ncbi:MAG: hypothetical protein KDA96_27040, partial [Planctomycetaceae bacterium]|nr:hypothetical protein [Planctomycetaceae bacterium]
DDEDCLANPVTDLMLFTGNIPSVNLTVTNNFGEDALLAGWIDYNGDGTFDNATEMASLTVTNGTTAASVTLQFPRVPGNALIGTTFARFRISTDHHFTDTPSATGAASDGEVEDYKVTITGVDFGDAPDAVGMPTTGNPYPTLLEHDGARHGLVGPFLGASIDREADGQPNSTATGDDTDGNDDEDGVTFTSLLIAGQMATLDITTSGAGLLNAWIDFNDNGSWADAGEQIFADFSLGAGLNAGLTFSIPADISTPQTFARFRFNQSGGLSDSGFAADGEVEDYAVTIMPAVPVLTGPATVTSNNLPAITWNAADGAVSYDVWLSSLTSGPNPIYRETVMATSWTPPTSLDIGRYRVWVRALGSENVAGDWSVPITFLVNTPVDVIPPVRTQPTLRPTIEWNPLPGAVTYDIWVDDKTNNVSQFDRQIVSSGNSYSPATDWAIGDYRIWVRGIDATGRPARWAAFRDVIAGQPPVIVQPPGSTFSPTPLFEWQAASSAVSYELLLINRNTGAQIQETGITATSFTVSTPLSVDLWAWHVLAVGTGGATP